MSYRIAVLGSGEWGATLAGALSARHVVRIWNRTEDRSQPYDSDGNTHRRISGNITAVDTVTACIDNADLILIATSSDGFAATMTHIGDHPAPVIWLCKGWDRHNDCFLHETAQRARGSLPYGVLSGPSFANEMGQHTSLVLAQSIDDDRIGEVLALPHFHLARTDDVAGISIAGAVKNVIAIAVGIAEGISFGKNLTAAIFAQGFRELCAVGMSMQAKIESFHLRRRHR